MKKRVLTQFMALSLLCYVTWQVCSYDYNRETVEENEVVIEKLEYSDINDLLDASVKGVDYEAQAQITNNIIYTIIEDDLLDELHETLYNAEFEDRATQQHKNGWLIYYLASSNLYCNTAETFEWRYINAFCEVGYEYVYIYSESDLNLIYVYNLNSVELLVYDTVLTERLLEAIDYAYIIGQGEETEGYDEAVQWFYDKAEENQEYVTREFDDHFTPEVVFRDSFGRLKPVNGNGWEWVLSNYDNYRFTIEDIKDYIGL